MTNSPTGKLSLKGSIYYLLNVNIWTSESHVLAVSYVSVYACCVWNKIIELNIYNNFAKDVRFRGDDRNYFFATTVICIIIYYYTATRRYALDNIDYTTAKFREKRM